MSYTYRIAKPCDAPSLSRLHFKVRENNSSGIFTQMRLSFLTRYYRIILNDPYEIVICAEDDSKRILGFNSCTLDADSQKRFLKKHKISLVIASVTSIICKPSLIKQLLNRYSFIRGHKHTVQYLVDKGVRGEYWVWDKDCKDAIGSVELNMVFRKVLKSLGVNEYHYEVDADNKNVLAYHKKNNDVLVDKIELPDGRKRYIMKSILTKNK